MSTFLASVSYYQGSLLHRVVVSSQENFLTLKGVCYGDAALTLIPFLEDAPKTLKEARREILLSRSCNAVADR